MTRGPFSVPREFLESIVWLLRAPDANDRIKADWAQYIEDRLDADERLSDQLAALLRKVPA